jgi:hypothetical protein
MRLIDKSKHDQIILVISELTELELTDAPQEVQDVFEKIPEENIEYVELTQEALNLARKYIADGVISESKLADAEHIAIATIKRVDILLSWNFHHIVNLKRIRGYNSVNLKYEYPLLEIRNPNEVLDYED